MRFMKQEFSTNTPRYEVRSPGWDHLEVFDDQKEAYQAVFNFALQFPNTEFCVVKKVNWDEEVIFKLNVNLTCGLDNIKEFYKSMVDLFQAKLVETTTWRRQDGR